MERGWRDIARLFNCSIVLLFFCFLFFVLCSLFHVSYVSASSTYYLGSIEREYDDAGVFANTKVYYPVGLSTAVRTISNQQSAISYLHPDHLGSTVVITKTDGSIDSSMAYYPYGDTSASSGRSPTDRLYTSQRKDSSTGLYYYNARYYNPKTAHFLSADKSEGPNRYSYVGNNPVMKNDPSGNKPVYGDEEQSKSPVKDPLIYWLPWYSTVLRPERPEYQTLLSEAKNVQKASGNILELFWNVTGLLHNSFEYNSEVKKRNNEKVWAENNKYKAVKNLDNAVGPDDYRSMKSQLHKWDNAKKYAEDQSSKASDKISDNTELIDQLNSGQGVCAQFALIGQYVFNELGLKTEYQRVGAVYRNGDDFSHAVLRATINDQEYIIDPTNYILTPKDIYIDYLQNSMNVDTSSVQFYTIYTGF